MLGRFSLSLALAVGTLSLAASAASAETHALVVGIDHYAHLAARYQLHGAAADAADIAEALQRRHVRDLVFFSAAEGSAGSATRTQVLAAIEAMIGRVARDDLVIIAFAGHGSSETWGEQHPPGVKQGDSHEVYLLSDFAMPDSRGVVPAEDRGFAADRIMGTEMAQILRRIDAKGARSIFVADTCHGGGLTREILPESGVGPRSNRTLPAMVFGSGQDPLAALATKLPAPIDTDKQLPNLTFLAAVPKEASVYEYEIPRGSKHMHGALSYAFARVIDGDAPRARPDTMTRGELMKFVLANVRANSEDAQRPDLHPRSDADFAREVIDFPKDFGTPTAPPARPGPVDAVRIFTKGDVPVALPALPGQDGTIKSAGSIAEADLIFDPATGAVYSSTGELVASQIAPGDLADVVRREIAQRRLIPLAQNRSRAIQLQRGDKRYVHHDPIGIEAGRDEVQAGTSAPEYYLLFDLAGDGTVQFLYPYLHPGDTHKDSAILPPDHPFAGTEARPPFGSDLLVFVVSPTPLDALIDNIRDLDGKKAALEAVERLEAGLTPQVRIGLQSMFTAPKPTPAP